LKEEENQADGIPLIEKEQEALVSGWSERCDREASKADERKASKQISS